MSGAAEPSPQLRDVAPGELRARCAAVVEAGARIQMAYAWFPQAQAPAEIRYLVHPGAHQPLQVWRCRPGTEPVPSLSALAPLLSWYEREMTDLCGVRFLDHPQPDPLVLLPGACADRPPLQPEAAATLQYVPAPAALPQLAGPGSDDVQLLPFGPVRADVLESAQFTFYYLGEAILHYHPQLFFKHRGMEKRFEGIGPPLGVVLAERVSAIGGVAHALAYCRAIESAAGMSPPPRAQWLRVLLAELERLYNHLHFLGHLCHTTTLKVGEAEGRYLEERAKQINARLSGSRLLRSVLTPGGLRRDLPCEGLEGMLDTLWNEFARYGEMLESSTTHLDRLITTGVLSPRLAFDQGATGPIERACGVDRDPRRDQPYAAYAELPLRVATRQAGDAHARQQVRIEEIGHSVELIRAVLRDLPAGPVHLPCRPAPGSEGLGWAEGPRGAIYYAVHLDQAGRLARVKIKSASFSNWRVFAFTVHDSNMMDYAINEASFGLSIAGCDR
jgi:Ni,Fe-hydrogenase III large subunit